MELGLPETDTILNARIREIRKKYGNNTILIGGPPCQAYSLVGRARNRGIASYVPENDPKHTLYQKYINILTQLRPAAFVMENVKGMLSSSLNETRIFERVLADLRNAGGGYRLVASRPDTERSRTCSLGALIQETSSSEPRTLDFRKLGTG